MPYEPQDCGYQLWLARRTPTDAFITTYSTYFAQELAVTPLDRFETADTAENRRYINEGHEEECLPINWRPFAKMGSYRVPPAKP